MTRWAEILFCRAENSTMLAQVQREYRALPWRTRAIMLFVCLVGCTMAWECFRISQIWAQERVEAEFTRAAEARTSAILREVESSLTALGALQAELETTHPTWEEFDQFANRLRRIHHSIYSLEWIPCVSGADRAGFERGATRILRRPYFVHDHLPPQPATPSAARDQYCPVYYVSPYTAALENIPGFDMLQSSLTGPSLRQALTSSEPVLTERSRLVEKRRNGFGIMTFLPVHQRPLPGTPAPVSGVVMIVFQFEDIVDRALASFGQQAGMELEVKDLSAHPGRQQLYGQEGGSPVRLPANLLFRRAVTIGGRHWEIVSRPSPGSFVAHPPREGYLALFATLGGTMLLCAYLWDSSRQTGQLYNLVVRLEAEVEHRREIQRAVERLSRQNHSILESAGEAICGVDHNGCATFVNPAVARITGWSAEELLGRNMHRLLHHSHSDGSVYPSQDCPILLSFRDGTLQHRDNEHFWRKDGSSFAVEYTSTPFREDGELAGTVVVFKDITARKQQQAWESDRQRILEMVARDEPLPGLLGELLRGVERRQPRWQISLWLPHNGAWTLVAASAGSSQLSGKTTQGDRTVADLQLLQQQGGEGPGRWCRCLSNAAGEHLGYLDARFPVGAEPASESSQLWLEDVLRLATLAIEHHQLGSQLAHQSQHDMLTGLPNRLLFADRLEQSLAQARRTGHSVGVLYLDLDRFKQINDSLGHRIGDLFLQAVSIRLKACLREGDTLARMGGDEFTVVLPEVGGGGEAERIADRLLDALRLPFYIEGYELFSSGSIGVCLYPDHGDDPESLLQHADSALYRAKHLGKDRYQFFDPEMSADACAAVELESQLRRAIEQEQFRVYYQPQVYADGRLAGLEALLRWQHPLYGLTAPARFIPLAEETGLIIPIGTWVLAEVCRQMRAWEAEGLPSVRVAVNVSALQFARVDFAEIVGGILADSGVAPELLELELTESWVMRNVKESERQLDRLRQLGVSISIDDFGTGYSSLSHLHQLPIDTVKVDRSFVTRIDAQPSSLPIIATIHSLAEKLGFRLIVEGVETELQMLALLDVGCEVFQGFLLGRPGSASEVAQVIARQSTVTAGETVPVYLRY